MVGVAPSVDAEIAEAILDILDAPWTVAFGGPRPAVVRSAFSQQLSNAGVTLDFDQSVFLRLGESTHMRATIDCKNLIHDAEMNGRLELPLYVYDETIIGIFNWRNHDALGALDNWASSPTDFVMLWGKSPPPHPRDGSRLEWLDIKSAKRLFADGVGRSMTSNGQISPAGQLTISARRYTVDSQQHNFRVLWSYPYFMSPYGFGARPSRPVTDFMEDGTYCFGGEQGSIEVWDKARHDVSAVKTSTLVHAF